MTIRARLNAKGAIAAPGAASIIGRSLTLAEAGRLDLDISGFTGGLNAACVATAGEGLAVVDSGVTDGVWTLDFTGAGAASLSVSALSGREWSGRVVVR